MTTMIGLSTLVHDMTCSYGYVFVTCCTWVAYVQLIPGWFQVNVTHALSLARHCLSFQCSKQPGNKANLQCNSSCNIESYFLQDEAIIKFSQHTKMNLEWSKRQSQRVQPRVSVYCGEYFFIDNVFVLYRCLSDNNWDFDKATVVFSLMQVS